MSYLQLLEKQDVLKDQYKKTQTELYNLMGVKYPKLTEDEINILVVDDKWMVSLEQSVEGEMDRISQRLTGRIKELAQRYEMPLPTLGTETEALTKKVDAHLKKMGFIW